MRKMWLSSNRKKGNSRLREYKFKVIIFFGDIKRSLITKSIETWVTLLYLFPLGMLVFFCTPGLHSYRVKYSSSFTDKNYPGAYNKAINYQDNSIVKCKNTLTGFPDCRATKSNSEKEETLYVWDTIIQEARPIQAKINKTSDFVSQSDTSEISQRNITGSRPLKVLINGTSFRLGDTLEVQVHLEHPANFHQVIIDNTYLEARSNPFIYKKKIDKAGAQNLVVTVNYEVPDNSTAVYNERFRYTVAGLSNTAKSKPQRRQLASFGYQHPTSIVRNRTKDVNVYISIENASEEIGDTLMDIASNQVEPGESCNDSIVIKTQPISVQKYIEVELIDPAGIWKIEKIHDTNRQQINARNGNRWRWCISTSTDQEVARLILKIKAEGSDMVFSEKDLHIKVEVDYLAWFRTGYIFFSDNPQSLLSLVFLPIIYYLGKRIFKKKKKKPDPPKDPPANTRQGASQSVASTNPADGRPGYP